MSFRQLFDGLGFEIVLDRASAPQSPYVPHPPVKDAAYLSWIRSLPCCVCGTRFRIEAHHTGLRGFGQIADDRSAIPLCFKHHDRRQPYSIHQLGLAAFCLRFGVNIPELVARLSVRPRLVLFNDRYHCVIDGEHYGLSAGLATSIAQLRDMRREMFAAEFEARTRRPVA